MEIELKAIWRRIFNLIAGNFGGRKGVQCPTCNGSGRIYNSS